jgi:hypothetical protein
MLQTSVTSVLVAFLFAGTLSAQSRAVSSKGKAMTPTERVCLSEILISTAPSDTPEEIAAAKKRAEQLRDSARSGASFARLAGMNSQGPSAAQGGPIGCFKRGQLAKPIEELVYGMKLGDVSDVLGTKQGFAILQVTGNEPQPIPAESPQQSVPNGHDTGVSGRVVGFERVPIRNALVLAHRNFGPDPGPDGSADVHVRTDASGQYAIPLPLGVYDVFISAAAFSPTSRKIQVTPDGMMIFDAVLEVNTLGMEKAVP